jgi:hypothetical protein
MRLANCDTRPLEGRKCTDATCAEGWMYGTTGGRVMGRWSLSLWMTF